MIEKMGFEANKRIRRKFGNRPEITTIGGQTCHFRSQFELKWAKYLQFLVNSKLIEAWKYESRTFYFTGYKTGKMNYLPDFKVIENDGTVVWQECKGAHDGPMNTRFKRMAEQYPDEIMDLVSWKFEKRNAQKRSVAKKYTRRIIDASEIFKQVKGLI